MNYYLLEGNYLFISENYISVGGTAVSGNLLNITSNETKKLENFAIGKAFIATWIEPTPQIQRETISVAEAEVS
jgi:hypothetical protein